MLEDSFSKIINDVYRLNNDLSPKNLDKKLEGIARRSPRKQSRICFHKDDLSKIQIMYICHLKDCEVKIHKHIQYPEWIFFLKAKAQVIYFDQKLVEKKRITIDTKENEGFVMHFIPKNVFHTLKFEEDSFFLEIKQGPFDKNSTTYF